MKASHVFHQAYEDAPRGQKTKIVDRLRHALVYACSGGEHTSLKALTNEQLFEVVNRLEDINAGRIIADYDIEDDAGVVFRGQDGNPATNVILWTDLETEPEPEDDERRDLR